MINFLATFVFFFAVVDPIGTVPVYFAVTSKLNEDERKMVARKATVISAGVLIFFIVFETIGTPAFGICLFIAACLTTIVSMIKKAIVEAPETLSPVLPLEPEQCGESARRRRTG